MAVNWNELFPTKLTFVIFMLYVSLFIGQGITVTASQESNNSYKYNIVTVVLLTDILKLVVSVSLYCKDNSLPSLLRDIHKNSNVLMLYFLPALLYCIYNNLSFVNLSTFDPTTYYLLLQLRVVITGILFQVIFKKYLSQKQWISLILLTCGCMLKNLDFNALNGKSTGSAETVTSSHIEGKIATVSGKNTSGIDLSFSAMLILVQVICSCLAGVYNEYLLKDKGVDVNIFVQNVFMYLNSIVCNVVVLLMREQLFEAFNSSNLSAIFHFKVLIVIVNNVASGIVTSFFLKYMNSILKTFAGALEIICSAVLCYFLFAIPIYWNTAFAIAVVSWAVYIYTHSPVVNLGKVRPITTLQKATHSEDKRKLLDSDDEANDLDMNIV